MSRQKSPERDSTRYVAMREQCSSCRVERVTATGYTRDETHYKTVGCLMSNRKECVFNVTPPK